MAYPSASDIFSTSVPSITHYTLRLLCTINSDSNLSSPYRPDGSPKSRKRTTSSTGNVHRHRSRRPLLPIGTSQDSKAALHTTLNELASMDRARVGNRTRLSRMPQRRSCISCPQWIIELQAVIQIATAQSDSLLYWTSTSMTPRKQIGRVQGVG